MVVVSSNISLNQGNSSTHHSFHHLSDSAYKHTYPVTRSSKVIIMFDIYVPTEKVW